MLLDVSLFLWHSPITLNSFFPLWHQTNVSSYAPWVTYRITVLRVHLDAPQRIRKVHHDDNSLQTKMCHEKGSTSLYVAKRISQQSSLSTKRNTIATMQHWLVCRPLCTLAKDNIWVFTWPERQISICSTKNTQFLAANWHRDTGNWCSLHVEQFPSSLFHKTSWQTGRHILALTRWVIDCLACLQPQVSVRVLSLAAGQEISEWKLV